MDAEYLKNTVGDVLARGCAAVIAAAPVDPIEHLSLWLLKHVENAQICDKFLKEKEQTCQAEALKKEQQKLQCTYEDEEKKKHQDAIAGLHSRKDDPYLLWDACLKAISTLTGCSSAYVALVLDKLWEPLPNKKGNEADEDSENQVEVEGGRDDDDDDDEEEEEEEEEPKQEANVEEDNHEEMEVDGDQEQGKDSEASSVKKKKKPPKSPNYKKKILLYVAATPENDFMINKQLNKKMGPVTYKILLEGISHLHVPNVLYQEGMHFFQGIPRMGSYFAVPVQLNIIPIQITAILCVDTLRKEGFGSGRPFSRKQQDFIIAISQAMGEIMTESYKKASANYKTKEIMRSLKSQFQKIEDSYKESLKREASEKRAQNKQSSEEVTVQQEEQEEEEEDPIEKEQTEKDSMNDDENEKEEDQDDESDEVNGEEEDNMEVEEDVHDEKDDDADVKILKETNMLKKKLKEQQKRVKSLEEKMKSCQAILEKKGKKVSKLEKQLKISGRALQYFEALLSAIVTSIIEHKDQEFINLKQSPFPSMIIYRVLKAVLCVLGHSRDVTDSWPVSRDLFDDNLCNALKNYDIHRQQKVEIWEFCDTCLDGITEENLSTEAPIGYLGQQWAFAAKKAEIASKKHQKNKSEYEHAAKALADVELEQMIAEIDLKIAVDEEKKLTSNIEGTKSTNYVKTLEKEPNEESASMSGTTNPQPEEEDEEEVDED